jgi:RecB family exonuclease
MTVLNPPTFNHTTLLQTQFLTLADWQAAFPILTQTNVNLVCNVHLNEALNELTAVQSNEPSSVEFNEQLTNLYSAFDGLYQPVQGSKPPLVIVEHPWQAHWLKQRYMNWFKLKHHQSTVGYKVCVMPHVMTLNQFLESCHEQSHAFTSTVSKQTAALLLCDALKTLKVDSIRSDALRYQLALQMVALIQEIDLRALLSKTLQQAGQMAQAQLFETTFLSREVQWLSVCQAYLTQIEADTGQQLHWRMCLDKILEQTAVEQGLKLIIPAPHPGLMMQVFLSQLHLDSNDEQARLSILLPDLQFDSTKQLSKINTYSCINFEHEAHCAAQHIQSWLKSGAKQIVVIAHDRVLGRRCAALLARQAIPVEDRVGWALSTTVAASTVRGVLTTWLTSDFEALLAWLALPMVQSHQAGAAQALIYLQQVWYKQRLVPDGKALIQQLLNRAYRLIADYKSNPLEQRLTDNQLDSNEIEVQLAVAQCLENWQSAQVRALKSATVAIHAQQLMAYLAPLALALQEDSAGIKVWQQLQLLAISTEGAENSLAPTVSLATFASILDQAFETERFSVSTHRYDSVDTARVIFMPFYELAWSQSQYVLMLGCNDAHFPAIPNNPTPLLASVRRELNIPLPVAEPAVWLHLLLNLHPTVQFYASFTPNEAGNPSRVSPWLSMAAVPIQLEAVPLIKQTTVTSIDSDEMDKLNIQVQPLSSLSIHALPNKVSVSELSKLVQCPYHFSLDSIFNIKPLYEPKIWPSYAERGNLLHVVLHTVHQRLNNNTPSQHSLQGLSDEQYLIQLIHQVLKEELQSMLHLSGRYAALVADCQRTVETYVSTHQWQISKGWKMVATELPIESYELIKNVRVHGKIDRLEVNPDSDGSQVPVYAVLDYKTSNENTLKEKTKQVLLDAQLALYSILVSLSGKPVEQAAYWRLHDGLFNHNQSKLDDTDYKKTMLSIQNLSEQTHTLTSFLQTEWQILTQGQATVRPSISACQYCLYSGVCRNAELTD